MNPELIDRLRERFDESDTEWRRLEDAGELELFLTEACGPCEEETKGSSEASRSTPGEAARADRPTGASALAPASLHEDGRGFTLADALLTETGSIVLTGRNPLSRRVAFLAETHFALVAEEEIFETLGDFLAQRFGDGGRNLRAEAGHQLTLVAGPSRTADIEKVLVLGAHGPRRLVLGTAPAALLRERFADLPAPGGGT